MIIIVDTNTKDIINNMGEGASSEGLMLKENETFVEIDNNSPLVDKIKLAEPHSYSLIFDKNNNVIDVNITKTIEQYQQQQLNNLDNLKQQKGDEMNLACQNAIINTFKSSAYDGSTIEDYACELTDQSRINGLVTIAQLRLANLTTEPINYYKNKDAVKCTEWQPQNMLALGLDLKRHIEKNTNHYEDLKIYINSLNSVEEVQKVIWDTVIPIATI